MNNQSLRVPAIIVAKIKAYFVCVYGMYQLRAVSLWYVPKMLAKIKTYFVCVYGMYQLRFGMYQLRAWDTLVCTNNNSSQNQGMHHTISMPTTNPSGALPCLL